MDWQKLMPPRGFQVLPRRWVVERTFSWIDQNRRMSKDYERLPQTSEAFIYVAMSRLGEEASSFVRLFGLFRNKNSRKFTFTILYISCLSG